MKVSAIVLAYNKQRLLNRTLDCLRNQTVPLHEIIVVDNGSPNPIRASKDIQLIRIDKPAPNCGTSEAKNIGATAAIGDYLLFTYHDTLHMRDAVECISRRVQAIGRDDLLINVMTVPVRYSAELPSEHSLYVRASMCDSDMILATLRGWSGGLCFEQHCGFIKRDFFTRIGGYDTKYLKSWGLNDQDLCLNVISHGGILDCDVHRSNGMPLFCFHQFSRLTQTTPDKAATRDAEFIAKYGYGWHDAWERRWAHRLVANR